MAIDLERTVSRLQDSAGRTPFRDLPELSNVYYAVWVDEHGAEELSALSPELISESSVYVGECVEQSVMRQLRWGKA
jgi:hypothetical protein